MSNSYILVEDYRGAQCRPCNKNELLAIACSEKVRTKIKAFREGIEKAEMELAAGLAEQAKATKATAYINKQTLPGFIFQAYDFDDNVYENKKRKEKKIGKYRKQGYAHCNGLAMIDIDHVDDPLMKWKEIEEIIKSKTLISRVMMAFITPSGHGLKIVFSCDTDMGNLIDNQLAFSKLLDVEIDESCKDASRLSFSPLAEDILYLDDRLFSYYDKTFDEKYSPLYNEGLSSPTLFPNGETPKSSKKSSGKESSDTNMEGEGESKDYSDYRYRGIPIPDIIEKWLDGKEPVEGTRHETLLQLAKELKYVCERNDDIVKFFLNQLPWVQNLRAEGDKVDNTISDALSWKLFKTWPKKIKEVVELSLPHNEDTEKDSTELAPYAKWGDDIESLFDVYPCLREVCYGLEKSTYPAAMFVGAAFFGTLMTRTFYHFYHQPERERRLNYGIMVIGDPGSGKSFTEPLYKLICAPIIAEDAVGNQMINDYKDKAKANANNPEKKKEKVIMPDVKIRIHGTRTANGVFIRDMNKCVDIIEGKTIHLHLLTYDSELDSATLASRGGQWIDKSTMELKAFHNEEDNQQYMNNDSFSGPFNVYWNYVYTGTPVSLQRKVNVRNFGTGLFSRLAVLPVCAKYFKMMELSSQSKKNEQVEEELTKWAFRLDKVYGELPLWPLVKASWEWVNNFMTLADIENNKADALLIRRIPYYGINIAAPYILMRHWDEWEKNKTFKVDKKDIDLCLLVMDIQHYSQKMYFGKFAEMYFDEKLQNEKDRVTSDYGRKTDELLQKLPDAFTVQKVMELSGCTHNNALVMLWRWKKRGLIVATGSRKNCLYKKKISG